MSAEETKKKLIEKWVTLICDKATVEQEAEAVAELEYRLAQVEDCVAHPLLMASTEYEQRIMRLERLVGTLDRIALMTQNEPPRGMARPLLADIHDLACVALSTTTPRANCKHEWNARDLCTHCNAVKPPPATGAMVWKECRTCGNTMLLPVGSTQDECSRCLEPLNTPPPPSPETSEIARLREGLELAKQMADAGNPHVGALIRGILDTPVNLRVKEGPR